MSKVNSAPYRSNWLPYLLVMPQLVITVLFFVWPAFQSILQSVQRQDAFGLSVQYSGLENFVELFEDENYLSSFKVTAIFSCLVSISSLVIALFFATLTNHIIKGKKLYQTLYIWPYAISTLVAAVLWVFLFDPSIGIITQWLFSVGYTWDYLINSGQAMALVVIAAVWKQISYNFIFFFAALQAVPKSLIEAATIDGAGPIKRFFSIIFPLITPTSFFLLVINIVYAFFDTFAIIDVTTQGGPSNSTEILVYKVYRDGFKGLDLGSSAAQSVILMTIVIVLTIIQFRYIEKKVNY